MHGLIITRELAVRAISIERPNEPIIGITKLMLLTFQDIRWIEYLPRPQLWNLDFYELEALILFKIRYR